MIERPVIERPDSSSLALATTAILGQAPGNTTDRRVPDERLQGSVERVTFHSEESGFCVLRVNVRGQRDWVTVVGTAAVVTAGEYVECEGWWSGATIGNTDYSSKRNSSELSRQARWKVSKNISLRGWSKELVPILLESSFDPSAKRYLTWSSRIPIGYSNSK